MSPEPIRLASLGIGWWSDVLADAAGQSDQIKIVSCFTRSEEKRETFAKKYGCVAADSYEQILNDPAVEGIINTTPNDVHLETTRAAAEAGKPPFSRSRSPIHYLTPERFRGSAKKPTSSFR